MARAIDPPGPFEVGVVAVGCWHAWCWLLLAIGVWLAAVGCLFAACCCWSLSCCLLACCWLLACLLVSCCLAVVSDWLLACGRSAWSV
eukprot:5057963-Heterocapsa_arctica.AAC.1